VAFSGKLHFADRKPAAVIRQLAPAVAERVSLSAIAVDLRSPLGFHWSAPTGAIVGRSDQEIVVIAGSGSIDVVVTITDTDGNSASAGKTINLR
jgi:hypothetical protein